MRSKSLLLSVPVICTGVALAACTTTSDVTRLWFGHRSNDSTYVYAAANRDLLTEIVGNPFGGAKTQVDVAVTGLMRGHDRGVGARFTTAPGTSARDGYKVAVVFDPAPDMPAADACSAARSAPGSGDRVTVLAVFCTPSGAYSGAVATLPRGAGLDDPAVVGTVKALTRRMLPRDTSAEPRED